jgi:hypothetical protein
MSLCLAHCFTKLITNVMVISTNKQPTNFQNVFNVLSQICQGKIYKTQIISNVPVGNITLCSWQHTAPMLRVGESRLECVNAESF